MGLKSGKLSTQSLKISWNSDQPFVLYVENKQKTPNGGMAAILFCARGIFSFGEMTSQMDSYTPGYDFKAPGQELLWKSCYGRGLKKK